MTIDTEPEEVMSVHDLAESLGDESAEIENEEVTEQDEQEPESSEESEQGEPNDEEGDESGPGEKLVIDGEEFDVPKELAPLAEKLKGLETSLRADHTRKTQEAAEMRKNAEAFHAKVNQDAAFQQRNIALIAEWQSLDQQLKQYADIDWGALAESDIGQYSRHKEIRDALRAKQHELAGEFQQRHEVDAQQRAADQRRVYEETVATVRKAIPGYNTETDAKAVKAAQKLAEKYGMQFDAAALSQEMNPLVWIGLVELSKHYELVDKRPVTQKKVMEAPRVIKNQQKPRNQEATKRLKQTGRIEDLAKLL